MLVFIELLLKLISTTPSTSPTNLAISLIDFLGIIPLMLLSALTSSSDDAIASPVSYTHLRAHET